MNNLLHNVRLIRIVGGVIMLIVSGLIVLGLVRRTAPLVGPNPSAKILPHITLYPPTTTPASAVGRFIDSIGNLGATATPIVIPSATPVVVNLVTPLPTVPVTAPNQVIETHQTVNTNEVAKDLERYNFNNDPNTANSLANPQGKYQIQTITKLEKPLKKIIYSVASDKVEGDYKYGSITINHYSRNSTSDPFNLEKSNGLTIRNKPNSFDMALSIAKNYDLENTPTSKINELFGLTNGITQWSYYYGQNLGDETRGIPGAVYRSFSPDYTHLIYVQKPGVNKKPWDAHNPGERFSINGDMWYEYENYSVMIEHGDTDLDMYEEVPFIYWPHYQTGSCYWDEDPVFWVSNNEFLYISDTEAETHFIPSISSKIRKMSSDDRSLIVPGLYAYNIDTRSSRLIEKIDRPARTDEKFFTWTSTETREHFYYWYGNGSGNFKIYNSKGDKVAEVPVDPVTYSSSDKPKASVFTRHAGDSVALDYFK